MNTFKVSAPLFFFPLSSLHVLDLHDMWELIDECFKLNLPKEGENEKEAIDIFIFIFFVKWCFVFLLYSLCCVS